jgi:Ca-activated chloride channel family protein
VIDQGHAQTTFRHIFQNESDQRLEGRYSISLGTVAAATGFSYQNGKEKIVGEIFEKENARQIYEAVTGTGRDPGLLEQTGEGTFSFRVAPILPGEKKPVQLSTSQWLPQRGRTLELALPLSKSGNGSEVFLTDTRAITKISSPTHSLSFEALPSGKRIHIGAPLKPTSHLVLRYQVQEDPLSLSTAWHRDGDHDGYLTVSLAAPPGASGSTQPRDVTLVIDRSGSMSGAPLSAARAASVGVIRRLRDDDRVNVIAFDDGVDALFDKPIKVAQIRKQAIAFVEALESRGGTDLGLALRTALERHAGDRAEYVLFMTDGQSSAAEALEEAKKAPETVRLYTVGIGAGVDRALLSKMAREQRGRFTFVADESNLEKDVAALYARIESPMVSNLKVRLLGARAHELYPRSAPDLFREDQLVWSMRVAMEQKTQATLIVSGLKDGEAFETKKTIQLAPRTKPWVGRLWAQKRVDDLLELMSLSGEHPELKRETLELALAYDIVTRYTSFLAIPESEVTDAVRGSIEQERARRAQILSKHADAASLSRTVMPPGDPVISVKAPADSLGVTAVFPFSLSLDLKYVPDEEVWRGRFLVPETVTDGRYQVRILVMNRHGQLAETTTAYEIDSRPPAFEVTATQDVGGVVVTVQGDEALREVRISSPAGGKSDPTLRLEGQTCARSGCVLARDEAARFSGHLELSPGKHVLRVVVTDEARNESTQTITVLVEDDGC